MALAVRFNLFKVCLGAASDFFVTELFYFLRNNPNVPVGVDQSPGAVTVELIFDGCFQFCPGGLRATGRAVGIFDL